MDAKRYERIFLSLGAGLLVLFLSALVYAAVGMEYPAAVRDAIAKWHRENPQHKRGANPYTLGDYGLDPEEIAEAYGVPVEAVQEAIAYCQADPPEIRQDIEDQDAFLAARGLDKGP